MRTQDRPHAGRGAGSLELDRSVDAIRVGAGERPESALGGYLSEGLGAGDADAKGEMGVDVKVDHSDDCAR